MPKRSAAKAACPRPEHAGSRVHLDGSYGRPGIDASALGSSVWMAVGRASVPSFSRARSHGASAARRASARSLAVRVRRRLASTSSWPAASPARAREVGAGAAYQRAALVARERASRLPIDRDTGELRETRHSQLVADWVELFAPVALERHRPGPGRAREASSSTTCPSACDSRQPGHAPVAFRVFYAMG